jgi:hypothetical protein
MRLTSTGLGIGTSSPAYKLDVAGNTRVGGSGNPSLTISGTDGAYTGLFYINAAGGGASKIFANGGTNTLQLGTNNTERLTLDASGNLGLGVTPSAWRSTDAAFQIGLGAFFSDSKLTANISQNHYFSSTGRRYIANGYATDYEQYNGYHAWKTAPSGTAGNAITFTQAMTLDASGRLGIGTTSPGGKLHVAGDGAAANLIRLQHTGTGTNGFFDISVTSTEAQLNANYSSTAIPMTFLTGASERMRISSTGYVSTNGNTASQNPPYLQGISFGWNKSNGQGESMINWTNAGGGTNPDITFNYWNNTTFSERMRITSAGLVGIGTSSPTQKLTLSGGTFQIAGASTFSDNVEIGRVGGDNNMAFATGGSERMRITSTGNVGIGTTAPVGKLSVEASGNHITMRAPAATAGKYWALDVSSANQFYVINNAGTQYFTMTDAGAATFTSSVKTAAPSGGTAKPFKIGAAAVVSPTSPNRTIEIEIDGTTYYLSAKTTND